MTTVSPIAAPAPSPRRFKARVRGENFALRPMEEADIGRAVSLICRAMNADEGGYAAQTLHLHFTSRKSGVDDGRFLYVLGDGIKIAGVAGLHHGPWGPPENVWLSWFALDPRFQRQGLGSAMLQAVIREARRSHFMNLYIETYSTPEFARARKFYRAHGFRQVGHIQSIMPTGGDAVVFYKSLIASA